MAEKVTFVTFRRCVSPGQITEAGAAGSSHQVHEVGHVVPDGDGVPDFLPQVDDRHQNEGEGDGARLHSRQGGEEDQHKDDAAGS